MPLITTTPRQIFCAAAVAISCQASFAAPIAASTLDQLLTVTDAQHQLEESKKIIKEILTSEIATQAKLSQEEQQTVTQTLTPFFNEMDAILTWPTIEKMLKTTYKQHLSEADAKALIEFYQTPTGKKAITFNMYYASFLAKAAIRQKITGKAFDTPLISNNPETIRFVTQGLKLKYIESDTVRELLNTKGEPNKTKLINTISFLYDQHYSKKEIAALTMQVQHQPLRLALQHQIKADSVFGKKTEILLREGLSKKINGLIK
jgi:hypothetical protein